MMMSRSRTILVVMGVHSLVFFLPSRMYLIWCFLARDHSVKASLSSCIPFFWFPSTYGPSTSLSLVLLHRDTFKNVLCVLGDLVFVCRIGGRGKSSQSHPARGNSRATQLSFPVERRANTTNVLRPALCSINSRCRYPRYSVVGERVFQSCQCAQVCRLWVSFVLQYR